MGVKGIDNLLASFQNSGEYVRKGNTIALRVRETSRWGCWGLTICIGASPSDFRALDLRPYEGDPKSRGRAGRPEGKGAKITVGDFWRSGCGAQTRGRGCVPLLSCRMPRPLRSGRLDLSRTFLRH
jgi:hypothetical protein